MRAAAIALLLTLLSGACAGSGRMFEQPLTKNSVRAMPPEQLNRRILGEVGRGFLPVVRRNPGPAPPTRPLDLLHFIAPARTADQPGLCFADHAAVTFEPVGALAGADTRVRPDRIHVDQDYFVRDTALLARFDPRVPVGSDEFWRSEAEACAASDPRSARLFHSAAGPRISAIVLRHALLAVGQARAGRLPSGATCESQPDGGGDPAQQCIAAFARLDVLRTEAIEECQRAEFELPTCYTLVQGVDGIDVRLDPQSGAPASLHLYMIISTYHPLPD